MWRRCWVGAPGSTARSSNPRPLPACSPYRPDPRIPGIGLAFFRDEVGGHLVVEHEVGARLQLPAVAGARRRGRGGGLHQQGQERLGLAGNRSVGAAQVPPRCSGPGDRDRGSPPPGTLGRAVWLVCVPRVVPRCSGGWSSEPRSLSAAVGSCSSPEPDPGGEPRPSLHPDDERDPYVFRIDLSGLGLGTARVVFSREPGGAGPRSTSSSPRR